MADVVSCSDRNKQHERSVARGSCARWSSHSGAAVLLESCPSVCHRASQPGVHACLLTGKPCDATPHGQRRRTTRTRAAGWHVRANTGFPEVEKARRPRQHGHLWNRPGGGRSGPVVQCSRVARCARERGQCFRFMRPGPVGRQGLVSPGSRPDHAPVPRPVGQSANQPVSGLAQAARHLRPVIGPQFLHPWSEPWKREAPGSFFLLPPPFG